MRERIERARAEAARGGGGGGGGGGASSAAPARPVAPRPTRPAARARVQVKAPPPRPMVPPVPTARERPRAASPTLSEPARPVQAIRLGGSSVAGGDGPVKLRLDRASLRQAIVAMEVLRPPVALREPGQP